MNRNQITHYTSDTTTTASDIATLVATANAKREISNTERRLRRAAAMQGLALHKTRGRWVYELGIYKIVDVSRNLIVYKCDRIDDVRTFLGVAE